ncbi:hypothetical protein ACFFX0_23160 [Citricoccus parietis]|uniref:Uncharacterized protein n=1 Tax=Citricoccus parietis TaxID=592307 RepID=A0ABV5FW68_9MICC
MGGTSTNSALAVPAGGRSTASGMGVWGVALDVAPSCGRTAGFGWVGVLAHCWVLGQQDRLLVQHMIAWPLFWGVGGGVVWGWLFRACGLVPAMLKH